MSALRRTRTASVPPAPDPEIAPLGSAVDELLKPIQKRAPRAGIGSLWRRLTRRPKA